MKITSLLGSVFLRLTPSRRRRLAPFGLLRSACSVRPAPFGLLRSACSVRLAPFRQAPLCRRLCGWALNDAVSWVSNDSDSVFCQPPHRLASSTSLPRASCSMGEIHLGRVDSPHWMAVISDRRNSEFRFGVLDCSICHLLATAVTPLL